VKVGNETDRENKIRFLPIEPGYYVAPNHEEYEWVSKMTINNWERVFNLEMIIILN